MILGIIWIMFAALFLVPFIWGGCGGGGDTALFGFFQLSHSQSQNHGQATSYRAMGYCDPLPTAFLLAALLFTIALIQLIFSLKMDESGQRKKLLLLFAVCTLVLSPVLFFIKLIF
jgi:hypothetical protein